MVAYTYNFNIRKAKAGGVHWPFSLAYSASLKSEVALLQKPR